MLIFIDETFRKAQTKKGGEVDFGALCGVGIPIEIYTKIATAVFKAKLNALGKDYAEKSELKGKKLLSPRTFRRLKQHPEEETKNLNFVETLVRILERNKLPVFGCVCFDQEAYKFTSDKDTALAGTFKSLCERINMYMKREHPNQKAIIVFDSRDEGTNERNARAVTNYLVRSKTGNNMRSSLLEIPLFAISQADNIGLQLADIVTTIIGLYAAGEPGIKELYAHLHRLFYTWKDNYGRAMSTLRWIDPQKLSAH